MNRRIINLAAAGVTLAGAALLTQPARAESFSCTEEQWNAAAAEANQVCAGASFTVSCHGNTVVVTIVACPPGNG